MEKLNHFSHPHPLVLVEEEMDWISRIYYCSARRERVEGSSYDCSECDFCLHKSCAKLPREINHPFHLDHPLILYEERPNYPGVVCWVCDFCSKSYEPGKNFVYHCSSCRFDLDIRCALLPNLITGDFPKHKHFSHQHSLFFIQNNYIEPQDQSCSACEEPVSGPVYCCFDCRFFLHQKCSELPLEIKHPSHRKHSLTLLANPPAHPEKCCCRLCSKPCKGFLYYCYSCEFGIKVKYALSDEVIRSKNHEHPFTLLSRPISFICDACGGDGEYCIPFVCTACNIVVHKECISLPQNILITRHDHPVSRIYYFLEEKQVKQRGCRICQNEINIEYGCYHCRGCDYFVHVDCAMDKDIFIQEYEVTDENQNLNQINLGWLSGEPSITRVLKEKRIGGEVIAIEIEHFNHPNKLILCDIVKDEKCCDACRRSISTSFYCCAECNYILHKRCAELPRKTRHWAFKDTFTLTAYTRFRCGFCSFDRSGLGYTNAASDLHCCVPCFLIPDTVTTQGHEHPVFFEHKITVKCSICDDGHQRKGAFICRRKECDHFTLDYTRLVLPNIAKYKYDGHPLVLTYRDDIHHHLDQCVCDICEEPRDPSEWFYYCEICDNSAHFLCVLGKYAFLKLGLTREYGFHEHPLTFVKKDYHHDYLKCSVCGKYCKDVFYKCTGSGCKYVIDMECRRHIWRSMKL